MKRILRTLWTFFVVRLRGLWFGLSLPIALLALAKWGGLPGKTINERTGAAAFVLNLFGLAAVAFGYMELREHFGRDSLWEGVKAYFSEFAAALKRPVDPQNVILGVANVTVSSHAPMVFVSGDPSLEQRVSALEGELAKHNAALEALRTEVEAKHAEHASQIAAEKAAREAGDTTSVSLIEGATVGGLGSELVGWIWLLFATLFAGAPGFWIRIIS